MHDLCLFLKMESVKLLDVATLHLRYEPKWIHDAATVLKGKVCSSQYFSV